MSLHRVESTNTGLKGDMESHGKSVTKGGQRVNYQTGVSAPGYNVRCFVLNVFFQSPSSGALRARTANIPSTNSSTRVLRSSPPTLSHPPQRTTLSRIPSTIGFSYPTFSRSPRRWRSVKRRMRLNRSLARMRVMHLSKAKCLRVTDRVRVLCSLC